MNDTNDRNHARIPRDVHGELASHTLKPRINLSASCHRGAAVVENLRNPNSIPECGDSMALYPTTRNKIYAGTVARVLAIYREEITRSFDEAIAAVRDSQPEEPPYDPSEPWWAVTDILADLWHCGRLHPDYLYLVQCLDTDGNPLMKPEVERLLDDLRAFCCEHDIDWLSALSWSVEHFIGEVDEAVRFEEIQSQSADEAE